MTPQPGHQPRYHGTDEETAAPAGPPRTAGQRRRLLLMIAIAVAVVLAVVILHLTGAVPAGAHG
jgi:hypothetical protein